MNIVGISYIVPRLRTCGWCLVLCHGSLTLPPHPQAVLAVLKDDICPLRGPQTGCIVCLCLHCEACLAPWDTLAGNDRIWQTRASRAGPFLGPVRLSRRPPQNRRRNAPAPPLLRQVPDDGMRQMSSSLAAMAQSSLLGPMIRRANVGELCSDLEAPTCSDEVFEQLAYVQLDPSSRGALRIRSLSPAMHLCQ